MLITTVGAFAAFSLMTIAVGTDYWLYSRGVCRTKSTSDNETSRKNEEVMTHSGLWRTCCLEGICKFLSIIILFLIFEYSSGGLGEAEAVSGGRGVGKSGSDGCGEGAAVQTVPSKTNAMLCGMKGLELTDCFWYKLHEMRLCSPLGSFCN